MTEDELKAIEARANAATPGPWMIHGRVLVAPNEDLAYFEHSTRADEVLIRSCREDIPALLAEVRDARAELTRLHALHEKWIGERAKILNDAPGGYTRDAALVVFNGVLEDFANAMRRGTSK